MSWALIQASPGSSQTEKFLNSPLSLEIKQTNAGGSPKMVNLSRNATGVSVFTDNGDSDPRAYNETDMVGVLFSLHPNQMQFYKDGEPVEPEIGDEYDATLTVDTEQGTQTDTIHFKIVDGKTVLANPPLKLPQSQNSKIQFNTTQSSGTAMSIHFEALADNGTVIKETTSGEIEADGHGPVIAGKHGASNPWGSFSTTVDTSDLPVGTKITAEARIAADVPSEDRPEGQSYVVVERANGTISAPPSADLSLSDQTGDGEKIVLDEVKLSDGGFVSLHLGSSTGKLLGTSGYLESGTKTDLTIELDSSLDGKSTVYAVAHQDTNGNQEFDFPTADGPYMSDGSATTASASYTLESQTPEPTTEPPTESTTEPMNGGTTNPAEETTTSGSGSGNGSGSGPGFTLVAALLSLLAVAAIVVRRR